MKLGIVVVYLFGEESAPLLGIHLRHIERYTTVPYMIYAGVNRLAAPFRDALARHPMIRVCECPDTPFRSMKEHAHYLDHLVRFAVEDGVTHVVTLHLDSFPIRSGWAEELAGKLSSSCVLATIDRINTACLFFHRDFYLHFRPSFLLSPAEREGAEYLRYIKEYNPFQHSGIGYGFTAYRNGKGWHYLKDTAAVDHSEPEQVYDDIIFHLGGAVFVGPTSSRSSARFRSRVWGKLMKIAVEAARVVTPGPVRTFLLEHFGSFIERVVDKPQLTLRAPAEAPRIQRFMEDPEKYLRLLERKIK